MKKKIITTAILALGLLQGASTAYAADKFTQGIGGTGDGTIHQIEDGGLVGVARGSLAIKLNGVLTNVFPGSYSGEGFINMALQTFPPVMDPFTFTCDANAVGNTEHQVALTGCVYTSSRLEELGIELTGDGECYITRDDHHREMACKFMYFLAETTNGVRTATAPVSFPTMF